MKCTFASAGTAHLLAAHLLAAPRRTAARSVSSCSLYELHPSCTSMLQGPILHKSSALIIDVHPRTGAYTTQLATEQWPAIDYAATQSRELHASRPCCHSRSRTPLSNTIEPSPSAAVFYTVPARPVDSIKLLSAVLLVVRFRDGRVHQRHKGQH